MKNTARLYISIRLKLEKTEARSWVLLVLTRLTFFLAFLVIRYLGHL